MGTVIFHIGTWHAVDRCEIEALAVIGTQLAERGTTQPHRIFQHCVEHRCEIAGRRVDDLQYRSGGGLLLEGFLEFGGTLVEFALKFGVGSLQLGHPVIKHYGYSILPRYALAASEPNIALNGRFPLRLPSGCHPGPLSRPR